MRPAILLAGGAILALASFGALAAPMTKKLVPFEDVFRAAGARHGLDWRLLAAHAFVESSFNPKARNPEGSDGLMQILFPLEKNTGVLRHLRAGTLPEFLDVDMDQVFDAAYNVELGAALIRENIKAFGMPRAIAVYNMDRARTAPLAGPFANQGYVDKVLAKARALGMVL